MREILAIGVISGTSADGIDAAALLTDGVQVTRTLGGVTVPYAEDLRAEVLSLMAAPERVRNADLTKAESAITAAHVAAVEHLIAVLELSFADIGVVGFHGQTVLHRPAEGFSRQLFDGGAAARRLGLPVVADFRAADMAAGGEGAPLAPIYHAARAAGGARSAPRHWTRSPRWTRSPSSLRGTTRESPRQGSRLARGAVAPWATTTRSCSPTATTAARSCPR